MKRWAVLLLLCAAACGGAAPAPEAKSPPVAALAPAPFTADQIRNATLPGRTYTFREEADGKSPVIRTLRFVKVAADGAELEVQSVEPPGEASVAKVSWRELQSHGELPRDQLRIHQENVTVPAGTYACDVYTVSSREQGVEVTRRFYFARELPGAPVLHDETRGGRRTSTTTLVAHQPGSAP